MKQNPLVAFVKTPKVMFQEYLHRLPQPGFSWHFSETPGELAIINDHLQQLRTNGISLLPGYFHGEQLRRLQAAFERALAERGEGAGNPGAEACFNLMDIDPVFLEVATDSLLLEIIARYYRKSFGIGRADALRIEPMSSKRYGSFQWHHDTRGKQVKIMIMLTDVHAHGQRMTYLRQSHHQYYSYYRSRGDGSRFELDLQSNPELASRVVNVTGLAGTVGIFDTNGLHSGNRNETARRDTLTFYYPTRESRNYRPLRYLRKDVAALDEPKRKVVMYNPLHELAD